VSPLRSLFTVLQCTILYGVSRKIGGSEGGRILRNSIAIICQPRGRCTGWRGNERGYIRAHNPSILVEGEEYMNKGQPTAQKEASCGGWVA